MSGQKSICPCCGQAAIVPSWEAALADLSTMQRRVVQHVARHSGLSARQLADAIYANDPNGGPDTAESVVRALIWQANRRLAPWCFRIHARPGTHGYIVAQIEKVAA